MPNQSCSEKARSKTASTLACGHPSGVDPLVNSKCGTCRMAALLEKRAKHNTGKIAEACALLAKCLRSGDIVVDKRGATLLEWAQKLKQRQRTSRSPRFRWRTKRGILSLGKVHELWLDKTHLVTVQECTDGRCFWHTAKRNAYPVRTTLERAKQEAESYVRARIPKPLN